MGLLQVKHTIFPKSNLLSINLQLRFLHRLVRLLNNGYPLLDALEIIKWDKKLINVTNSLIHLLKGGSTIDVALEQAKFHPEITSYLYFVYSSGDLETNLNKCLLLFENKLTYMNKFKQTIRYPLILFLFFFILLTFLQHTVLPSFIEIFQLSNESSSMVLLSLHFINIMSNTLITFTIITGVSALIWYFYKDKISTSNKIAIYRRIPLYRKFLRIQTSFLFATHFNSLLKTGLSMKNILNILAEQNKLPILSHYSFQLAEELSNGIYINVLLSKFDFITPRLALIFQHNVDADLLEKDLSIYTEYLTDELHRKITKILTIIQPSIFIVLACFIVFIYVTLMWPMFQLIKTI